MLNDEDIERITADIGLQEPFARWKIARAIESAATAPLLARIEELEANEKVLLAQVQGHTRWREKIIKASEKAYGESAIRYKFSLTKNGKCMNTFPKDIDGRWFALVPAEDDGHIGHIARIAELTRELEEARKDAERWNWLNWHIGVAWGEEGFTSLIRIVSEKHRALINTQIDKLMSGELPETPAIRAAIKEQT